MSDTVTTSPTSPTARPTGFPGEAVAKEDFPLSFTARALEMIRSAL